MGLDVTGIGAVADLAKTVVARIWPDKTAEEQAQLAATLTIVQGQLDANKAEAENTNWFVAGARPFIMWVCGVAFACQFVVGPLAEWGSTLAGHPVKFPQMDMGTMMPLLFGMLGLGAYRTAEKLQGVQNNH